MRCVLKQVKYVSTIVIQIIIETNVEQNKNKNTYNLRNSSSGIVSMSLLDSETWKNIIFKIIMK